MNNELEKFPHLSVDDMRLMFERSPLMLTVVNGDIDALRAFIANGTDVNARIGYFRPSLLSLAVLRRQYDIVELLLASGADVNCANGFYSHPATGAHAAVWAGDLRLLKRMLDANVNVELLDDKHRSVFDCAATLPHASVLAFLLKNAPRDSIFANNQRTHSLLTFAAANSNEAVMALALTVVDGPLEEFAERQSDWRMRESIRHSLLVAAKNDNPAIMRMLISRGCDVNVSDCEGSTACHIAAANPNADVLAVLLRAKGVHVAARDVWHRTLCHIAAANPNSRVLQVAIDAGVPLDSRDLFGRTPIWSTMSNMNAMLALLRAGANHDVHDCAESSLCRLAAIRGRHDVVRILVDRGIDVHRRDKAGRTIAHHAAASGSDAVLALVRAAGADVVDARDIHGSTPLIFAGSTEVVKLLLDAGADPRCVGRGGRSAFSIALDGRKSDSALLLLAAGATVDDVDQFGVTNCHRAARTSANLLRAIIRRGVDPHALDSQGRSAAFYATGAECVAVLFAVGVNFNAVDRQGRSVVAVTPSYGVFDNAFVTMLAAGVQMSGNVSFSTTNAAVVVAAGFTVSQFYLSSVTDEALSNAIDVLAAKQRLLMRERAVEVCVGLQARQLPALVSCTILEHAFDPMPCMVTLHFVWQIVTTVKHFKK
jgi:ankyrin repeat protein